MRDRLARGMIGACALFAASCGTAGAGQYVGTGFLISSDGLVLTDSHVIADCIGPVEVNYPQSDRRRAVVVADGKNLDLALLATGFRDVPYLRLRAVNGHLRTPVRGELVHTAGFIDNRFSARGGQISSVSDPALVEHTGIPALRDSGAVMNSNIGFGASGSPVVDDDGLLVGIVWGADFTRGDYAIPHIMDNAAIYSFLKASGVDARTGDAGAFNPIKRARSESAWAHVRRMEALLSQSTVRVSCRAD